MNVLDLQFKCGDLGRTVTIREYFKELLLTLWAEEEGFSGKRPFGNSGWQHDVYQALIRAGFIPGQLDEYGCVEQYDRKSAERFVLEQIIAKL